MSSPNLGITHVAASQDQKEVVVNEAIDKLDQAIAGTLAIAIAPPAPATLDPRLAFSFTLTGTLTSGATVTVKPVVRVFVVANATAQAIVLSTGVAQSKTVAIAAGGLAMVYCDGTNVLMVQELR
jgi:hypothetical protein